MGQTRNRFYYFFKLYALDTALQLQAEATKDALLRAMQGHILAQAQLVGIYQRKPEAHQSQQGW